MSIIPKSGDAILFYSQDANGNKDLSSHHGGCPVISGQKWAANLWIWNGPRFGFKGSPVRPRPQTLQTQTQTQTTKKEKTEKTEKTVVQSTSTTGALPSVLSVSVDFSATSEMLHQLHQQPNANTNTNRDRDRELFLYWKEIPFGTLQTTPQRINSFPGHEFSIRDSRGEVVGIFTVEEGKSHQEYVYGASTTPAAIDSIENKDSSAYKVEL